MIGERAVALSEEYARLHSERLEQPICQHSPGAIAAVYHTLTGREMRPILDATSSIYLSMTSSCLSVPLPSRNSPATAIS